MKFLLGSMFLMFLSYGCGEDNPTASEPTLDTTAKKETQLRTIQRWDGDNWVENSFSEMVIINKTWRYISHSATLDGRVKIKGGYSFDFHNPNNDRINISVSKFIFADIDGIPIYEYELPSYIDQTLEPKGDLVYPGSFEIILDNLDASTQITRLGLWASFFFPRE